MDSLKPCPFCGARAEVRHYMNSLFVVGCFGSPICPGTISRSGPVYVTAEDAEKEWNRRAIDGHLVAQAEIEGGGYNYYFVCSECNGVLRTGETPCPHCGSVVEWPAWMKKAEIQRMQVHDRVSLADITPRVLEAVKRADIAREMAIQEIKDWRRDSGQEV